MTGERKMFFQEDNGGFNNPRMFIDSRKIEKIKLEKERKEKELLLRNRVAVFKKMIANGELDTGDELLSIHEEDLVLEDLLILDKMTPLILSEKTLSKKEMEELKIRDKKISKEKILKIFPDCFKAHSKYKAKFGKYFADKSIESDKMGVYNYDFHKDPRSEFSGWIGNRLMRVLSEMSPKDRKVTIEMVEKKNRAEKEGRVEKKEATA